jgi:hypothetical protein
MSSSRDCSVHLWWLCLPAASSVFLSMGDFQNIGWLQNWLIKVYKLKSMTAWLL